MGAAGTVLLHGVAIHSAVVGSMAHRSRAPELIPGTAIANAVAPSEELVLVSVGAIQSEVADLPGPVSFLSGRLDKVPIAIAPTDSLPPMDIASETDGAAAAQRTPGAGDPEIEAIMFGRYTGQISARIERAWIRPRTPVEDAASGPNDEFKCRVQIRQDEQGNVREVLLLECNGTTAWQHSLIMAINQSSPLNAPPVPSVFSKAVTMTFEAHASKSDDARDAVELNP